MYQFPQQQYTRKSRGCHLAIALLLAAGGVPAHGAAPASAGVSGEQTMTLNENSAWTWEEIIYWYLKFLHEMMRQMPPPKWEDPTENQLMGLNVSYATDGIRTDLTLEERENYTLVVLDFMDELVDGQQNISEAVYEESMKTLLDILEDLDAPAGGD